VRLNLRSISVAGIIILVLIIAIAIFSAGCNTIVNIGNINNNNNNNGGEKEMENLKNFDANEKIVVIEMENGGLIEIELYPDQAPITVNNFLGLVESGFYKDIIFHRVIKGFMIQGGDPTGTGTGGSGTNIKGEFKQNGVDNTIKHERGVISMARSQNKDSASSQFFIMHANSSHLDGAYAAFGKVISGMEVVDAIADVEVNSSDKPLVPQVIKEARIEDRK